jgi:uncharacterized protein YecE (DUF72 family)
MRAGNNCQARVSALLQSRAMATVRIGISGWVYPAWRGVFYPKGTKQKDELAYASKQLPIIEINGSFYSLQKPASYAKWYAETPSDFVFSVKGPKYVTHERRLKDVATPIANFLASGIFNLREKLGPLLWQIPPNLKYDAERIENFLKLLPHDTKAAETAARGHSDWMKDRSLLESDAQRPLRHAFEVRHESFKDESFMEMLRKYNVAVVFAESAGEWPEFVEPTADFVYMRLHGDGAPEEGGYSDAALAKWADRIRTWRAEGRDVYGFFDGENVKLRAPADAQTLQKKVLQ